MSSEQTSPKDILKQIVTQFGKQIFDKSESTRLEGLLSDYLTDDKAKLKLFRLAIKDNIAHELLQAGSLDKAEKAIKTNALKTKFQSENSLEKSVAFEIVDSLAYALGWIKNVEKQTTAKTEINNNTETKIINQKPEKTNTPLVINKNTIQNINQKDKWGNTKLHDAVSNNDSVNVEYLIQAGAKIDIINRIGETPLLIAVHQNNQQIVEILLKAGANIDLKNEDGCTPLICAAKYGYAELAKLLIAKGANINKRDNSDKTAKRWAMDMKNEDVIAVFKNQKSAHKSQPSKKPARKQIPQPQTLLNPIQQPVEKKSKVGSWFGLIGSLVFVLIAFFMLKEGENLAVAFGGIILFGGSSLYHFLKIMA